ncbi:uncharacterized protein B0H18DRAFT_499130 [Fomitopsis serialis]|uniref:uncharacterized protein n=1 Tax=Fomitopsis serialis TaxID=139415 RepID=UPI002007FF2E|nr:uncharacterized protein B0H18DRAFT_499130 [Neoantrodia serialis]KAH9922973.1 hypothetical protein B0H18DRAFT_499130 [Neoantrodia serialis]
MEVWAISLLLQVLNIYRTSHSARPTNQTGRYSWVRIEAPRLSERRPFGGVCHKTYLLLHGSSYEKWCRLDSSHGTPFAYLCFCQLRRGSCSSETQCIIPA